MNDAAHRVRLTKLDESVPHALHQHYDGQDHPQPCHIALDLRDGELSAAYNPETGDAIPSAVYHGHVHWWAIPCLIAADANRLLRKLKPLAHRMLAGSSVHWRPDNIGSVLTPDAQSAGREIRELIADQVPNLEHVVELDADEWFGDGPPEELSATTTDDELAEIVAEEEREAAAAHPHCYTVLRNAEAHLTDLRETLRESHRDELRSIIKELNTQKEARDRVIVKLRDHGDSSRAIASFVGRSHVWVGNVVHRQTGSSVAVRVNASDAARQTARDRLAAILKEISDLEDDRNRLMVQLHDFGDSTRAIGLLVGWSHVWVGKLLKRMAETGRSGSQTMERPTND